MNLRTLDLQKNEMSNPDAISTHALKPLKKLKVYKFNLDTQSILVFILYAEWNARGQLQPTLPASNDWLQYEPNKKNWEQNFSPL